MQSTPRHLAIKILCRRQDSDNPVDQIMDQLVSERHCPAQDRQLVMAIVYGVLRHQRYLDFLLARVSRHPLTRMKPMTLQALRVGLYQLVFMDRIPPSAAVNETIKALHAARQPKWLVGFVNGLLRTLAGTPGLSASPGNNPDIAPAIAHSHPDWLFERWHGRYGLEKTISLCLHNNSRPPLSLAINSRRISRDDFLLRARDAGIVAQAGTLAPDAVLLPHFSGPISQIPGYHQGFFSVQDEGAQLIVPLLAPFPIGHYLDACAGVGGKTIQIAQLVPAGSRITAIEPNAMRFALLRENIDRMSPEAAIASRNSTLADFAASCDARFAAVLVDAPCSGLGVIRRQPDIRWNRSPEDLRRYHQEQLNLLQTAASLVAPGGALLYATCSSEPEENKEVATSFLRLHPDFSPAPAEELAQYLKNFINGHGFFELLPGNGHDGFFAARFHKNEL